MRDVQDLRGEIEVSAEEPAESNTRGGPQAARTVHNGGQRAGAQVASD